MFCTQRYDIAVVDEHTSDAPDAMRGTQAIEAFRAHEASRTVAGGEGTSGGAPPRAVLISCSGNADSEGFTQEARAHGADSVWNKPFPNCVNGEMQRELMALLRAKRGGA